VSSIEPDDRSQRLKRVATTLFIAALAPLGCNHSSALPPLSADLAVGATPDLASPVDLAAPGDLAPPQLALGAACQSSAECARGVCFGGECTAIPVDGTLVGYWPMDDTGSTVVDHSGNGNNGLVSGANQVAGHIGNAYQFARGQCIGIPQSASLQMVGNTAVSVLAWFNSSGCPAGNDSCLLFNNDFEYELGLAPGDALQLALLTTQVTWNWDISTSIPALNAWHLAAMTWDGATARLYLDGSQVSSWAVTGSFGGSGSGAGIGCYHVPTSGMPNAGTAGGFVGAIDEVAVYRRALSGQEISAYYDATK
jgi:hypothetical protein